MLIEYKNRTSSFRNIVWTKISGWKKKKKQKEKQKKQKIAEATTICNAQMQGLDLSYLVRIMIFIFAGGWRKHSVPIKMRCLFL